MITLTCLLRNLYGIRNGQYPFRPELSPVAQLLAYRVQVEKTLPRKLSQQEIEELVREGFGILVGETHPTGPYVSDPFLSGFLSNCRQQLVGLKGELRQALPLFQRAACTQ